MDKQVVNNALIRPYFLEVVALGLGPLDFHETLNIFKYYPIYSLHSKQHHGIIYHVTSG